MPENPGENRPCHDCRHTPEAHYVPLLNDRRGCDMCGCGEYRLALSPMEYPRFSDPVDDDGNLMEHCCKNCGETIPSTEEDLIAHMWFHDSERLTTICRCQHHEWAHRFGRCIGDLNRCTCIDFRAGPRRAGPE